MRLIETLGIRINPLGGEKQDRRPRRRGASVGLCTALSALLALGACTQPAGAGSPDTGFSVAAAAAPASDSSNSTDPAGAARLRLPRVSRFGAYLAGRFAQDQQNYGAALAFYAAALQASPTNADLALRVLVLAATEGRFDVAVPLARTLVAAVPDLSIANLILGVQEMKDGNTEAAAARLSRLEMTGFYHYAGTLAFAWTQPPAKALAALDGMKAAELNWIKPLQAALIADLAGDPGAVARYRAALAANGPLLSYRLTQFVGNFLERQGDRSEAAALYHTFNAQRGIAAGTPLELSPGKPAPLVANAREGMAETLFELGSASESPETTEVTLLSARLALQLRPNLAIATSLLGETLVQQNRLDEALAAYRSVPADSGLWRLAQLRIADLLYQQGHKDEAQAMLRRMATQWPDWPQPLVALGDQLRDQDRYGEAANIYTEALTRVADPQGPEWWAVYYDRGRAYERGDDWVQGEADLRHAMALHPDDPGILNYLGYALAERGEKLPEAYNLVKRAVELAPEDGYIVDSLGWVAYKRGDSKGAIRALERAVELKPSDPEINAHLGNAYWQAGREDDAMLQWRRALTLDPDKPLEAKIEGFIAHPPARKPVRPAAAPRRPRPAQANSNQPS